MVTESGISHRIPLDGATVFAYTDGQVVIRHISRNSQQFHPIYPDQSFLEIIRLREQARGVTLPPETASQQA